MFVELEELDYTDLNSHGLVVMFDGEADDSERKMPDFSRFHVLFTFGDVICRSCNATAYSMRSKSIRQVWIHSLDKGISFCGRRPYPL